ncbi:uncharacterized protein ISCGN_003099 [Ixodes scapularis]
MAGSTPFECEADHEHSTENVSVLRVNLSTDGDAHEWLASYSNSTNTSWIVDWRSANARRMVFHQKWVCHRSSRYKTTGRHSTGCPAFVDIKVKKVSRDTKRRDPFLKRATPLAAVVKLGQHHNHSLDDAEAKRLLRSTPDTRALFLGYFRDGLTVAKAMALHREKLSAEDNALERLASNALNPNSNVVYHWYKLWRKQLSSEQDPTVKLDEKAASYLRLGVDIKTAKSGDGSCWAISVVTKIMRRTQQLDAARETIFLDSTFLVTAASTLTTFLAATGAGAIPLAVVLHGPRGMESYATAFGLLKRSYPLCFGGAPAPRAFVTSPSSAEKEALNTCWPGVSQLLYPLDVVQAEWDWLSAAGNEVGQEERLDLMAAFQKVMYAESEEELEAATTDLRLRTHQGYVEHVNALLEQKTEWVLLFRHDHVVGDDDTHDFAEASVRILRDLLLHNRKAFNVVALVNFVTSQWEDYFRRRLLAHARNRRPVHQLHHDKLLKRLPESAAEAIEVLDNNIFRVPSGLRIEKACEVIPDVGTCTCRTGQLGAFCRHQALVHNVHGGAFPDVPVLTADDQKQLEFLALGEKGQTEASFPDTEEALSERPTPSASDEGETSAALSDRPTYSGSEEEEPSAPLEPPPHSNHSPDSEQQPDCSTFKGRWQRHCQKADEVLREIQARLKKCHAIAVDSPTYLAKLERMLEGIKKIEQEPEVIPRVSSPQTVYSWDNWQNVAEGTKRVLDGCLSNGPSAKVPKQEHS